MWDIMSKDGDCLAAQTDGLMQEAAGVLANYHPFTALQDKPDEESDRLARRHTTVAACVAAVALVLTAIALPARPAAAADASEDSFRTGFSDQWFGQQLAELWRYDAGSAIFSPPVTDGRAIYSGSDAGRFFALDPATGNALWTYEAGSAVKDPPCLADDRVYFSTLAGDVVALSAETGAFIWRAPMAERIYAGVLVAADRVIVPCSDGYVRGLSTADGSLVWKQPVGLGIRLLSTPGISGGAAIVESDGAVRALDPLTGAELWKIPLRGEFRNWPAILGDRAVTAGSGDAEGGLSLIDTSSGTVVNKYIYSGDNHWAAAAIDPADCGVYAGLEGGIFSFDSRLSRLASWVRQPEAKSGSKWYVMWQPLILRDRVVVPGHLEISNADALFYFTRDGRLSFLGKTLLPEKLAAPPLVYDSVLYYGSLNGHLIALAPVRVTVNDRPVDFGPREPLTQPSGRIIVPARAVVEAAGGTVDWDADARLVTARFAGHTVEMTVDSDIINVDGQPVTIDEPARIVNGSTLVPIRKLVEGLGGQVTWDSAKRTVVIVLGSSQ